MCDREADIATGLQQATEFHVCGRLHLWQHQLRGQVETHPQVPLRGFDPTTACQDGAQVRTDHRFSVRTAGMVSPYASRLFDVDKRTLIDSSRVIEELLPRKPLPSPHPVPRRVEKIPCSRTVGRQCHPMGSQVFGMQTRQGHGHRTMTRTTLCPEERPLDDLTDQGARDRTAAIGRLTDPCHEPTLDEPIHQSTWVMKPRGFAEQAQRELRADGHTQLQDPTQVWFERVNPLGNQRIQSRRGPHNPSRIAEPSDTIADDESIALNQSSHDGLHVQRVPLRIP